MKRSNGKKCELICLLMIYIFTPPPPPKKPFKLITKIFFLNVFTNAVCMMGLYYT